MPKRNHKIGVECAPGGEWELTLPDDFDYLNPAAVAMAASLVDGVEGFFEECA